MFDKEKYISKGVNKKLSTDLIDTQPINAKIYCIDDNIGHSTMILAEEY